MTSHDPLPRADAAPEPTPSDEDVAEVADDTTSDTTCDDSSDEPAEAPADETGPDTAEESSDDPVEESTDTTAPARRTLVERLPESWRAPLEVPRWEVAVAIGVISVLVAVAIAASGLALTQESTTPTPAAADGAVSIADNFARGSLDSLGVAPTGQHWDELRGEWAIGFNSVQVLEPDGNLPSLAVVDLGDTDGAVRVRLGKVTAGMGVAVRVLDAGNYLAVEAAPGYGTFAVRRSVNGQMTELGGVGLVRAADNSVLEIRMRGNSIDIYVDSVFKKTFVDRPRQGATRVGMIGEAGSAAARWTMFEAQDNAALTEGDPLPDVAVEDDTSPDGTTGTTTVED